MYEDDVEYTHIPDLRPCREERERMQALSLAFDMRMQNDNPTSIILNAATFLKFLREG